MIVEPYLIDYIVRKESRFYNLFSFFTFSQFGLREK